MQEQAAPSEAVPTLEYGMSLRHRIITIREAMEVEREKALREVEEQRKNILDMLEADWKEAGYESEINRLEKEIEQVIQANAKIGNFKEGRYILKNIARSPPREVDPNLFQQAFPEVFITLATIPLGKAEKKIGEEQLIPLLKPQKQPEPKYELTVEIKKGAIS
jgi:hypothetical protein